MSDRAGMPCSKLYRMLAAGCYNEACRISSCRCNGSKLMHASCHARCLKSCTRKLCARASVDSFRKQKPRACIAQVDLPAEPMTGPSASLRNTSASLYSLQQTCVAFALSRFSCPKQSTFNKSYNLRPLGTCRSESGATASNVMWLLEVNLQQLYRASAIGSWNECLLVKELGRRCGNNQR